MTLQYPTGLGVALFGADGWTIKDNNIFGNFKWGVAMFSDPFNDGLDAMSQNNQVLNNEMGAQRHRHEHTSTSGSTAPARRTASRATTARRRHRIPTVQVSTADLYPGCPAPAGPTPGASGTSDGDLHLVGELVGYVGSTDTNPPEDQECSWNQHPHPPFKNFEPVDITPGPANCP